MSRIKLHKRILALFLALVMVLMVVYTAIWGIEPATERRVLDPMELPTSESVIEEVVDEEAMAKINRCVELTDAGTYEEAMHLIEELLVEHAEENLLLFYRGNIYFYQEMYEEALADYEKAYVGHEDIPELSYLIGCTHLAMNDSEKALEYILIAMDKGYILDTMYEQCILLYQDKKDYTNADRITGIYEEQYPEAAEPFMYYGNTLLLQEKNAEAGERYRKALEKNPDEELKESLLLNVAECYLLEENYEKSIEYYNQYLTLVEDAPEAYLHRGLAKMQLQQYEEAIKDFDVTCDADYELAASHLERGLCYYMLGRYSETERETKLYCDFVEDGSEAWLYLAISLYMQEKYDESMQYFKMGFENNISKQENAYYLGSLCMMKDAYKDAVTYYSFLLENEYETETAHYNRGVSYLNLEMIDEATSDFTTVVEEGNDETLIANAEKVLKQLEALGGEFNEQTVTK